MKHDTHVFNFVHLALKLYYTTLWNRKSYFSSLQQ